LKPDLTDRTI